MLLKNITSHYGYFDICMWGTIIFTESLSWKGVSLGPVLKCIYSGLGESGIETLLSAMVLFLSQEILQRPLTPRSRHPIPRRPLPIMFIDHIISDSGPQCLLLRPPPMPTRITSSKAIQNHSLFTYSQPSLLTCSGVTNQPTLHRAPMTAVTRPLLHIS